MPRDNLDDKPTAAVGRTHRGEVSPPITTPAAVVELQAKRAAYAKPGAVDINVYFAHKGIQNPILRASMAAYTEIRTATVEDFDEIFAEHHEVPAPRAGGEAK